MKKLLALILVCIIIAFSFYACNKKDEIEIDNAPIGNIDTSKADKEDGEEIPPEEDFSDRTEESDRKEIENNLRDAEALINDGLLEDAAMIIESLKTRELTEKERKQIRDLQSKMIVVSD